ncbi:MAG: DNA-binding protein, partial [Paludibacteraceae bacterium]|nr:DNA-binding protein [Paludibacteraceae bacterium]
AVGTNTYVSELIAAYMKLQASGVEKRGEYDKLIDEYVSDIAAADGAEGINKVLGKFSKQEHIFNSRLKIGKLIQAKAAELGLKYDEKKKKYA